MKNVEIQQFSDSNILILFSLMVLTMASYGWFSRSIFTSEKNSIDQAKAEVLAYQAAQIFLLKNVEKQPRQSRSLASVNRSINGLIGEDSAGKPLLYSVIQENQGGLRVLISKDHDQTDQAYETIFELHIDLPDSSAT